MNHYYKDLTNKIAELRSKIISLENELKKGRAVCSHTWKTAEYTPDIREAYTAPGDPPGTMGVDWRGPCSITRKETPKWTRTCKYCGTEETTTQASKEMTKIPKFQ